MLPFWLGDYSKANKFFPLRVDSFGQKILMRMQSKQEIVWTSTVFSVNKSGIYLSLTDRRSVSFKVG